MNYYRCQANSITFHFLTVTRKVNFLEVLMFMFSFPTTAHRAVVMVFLSAVRLYYKEVASSPTYSLNFQNQPSFHKGSPLVIGFSYAPF